MAPPACSDQRTGRVLLQGSLELVQRAVLVCGGDSLHGLHLAALVLEGKLATQDRVHVLWLVGTRAHAQESVSQSMSKLSTRSRRTLFVMTLERSMYLSASTACGWSCEL